MKARTFRRQVKVLAGGAKQHVVCLPMDFPSGTVYSVRRLRSIHYMREVRGSDNVPSFSKTEAEGTGVEVRFCFSFFARTQRFMT